jgi:hypothetical protein
LDPIRVFDVVNSTVKPYEEVKDQIFQDLAKARSLSDTKKFAQSWLERRVPQFRWRVITGCRKQPVPGCKSRIATSMPGSKQSSMMPCTISKQVFHQTLCPGQNGRRPVVKAVYPAKKPHDDKQLIYRLFINRLEISGSINWLEAQIAAAKVKINI